MMNEHIQEYFKLACEAYRIGNIETSYNAPIMALMTQFGCIARDLSGGRSGQTGENPDIKIWRSDVEISETEPFSMIEVKKSGWHRCPCQNASKERCISFWLCNLNGQSNMGILARRRR